MTRHIPISAVIGHVHDTLNDPAADVHTVCPSFHGFGLQGYAYDFVWATTVTHEVVSIQMSDSEKKQAINMTTEIHHQQTFGCYTLETGFFQCIFVLLYIVGLHFIL